MVTLLSLSLNHGVSGTTHRIAYRIAGTANLQRHYIPHSTRLSLSLLYNFEFRILFLISTENVREM